MTRRGSPNGPSSPRLPTLEEDSPRAVEDGVRCEDTVLVGHGRMRARGLRPGCETVSNRRILRFRTGMLERERGTFEREPLPFPPVERTVPDPSRWTASPSPPVLEATLLIDISPLVQSRSFPLDRCLGSRSSRWPFDQPSCFGRRSIRNLHDEREASARVGALPVIRKDVKKRRDERRSEEEGKRAGEKRDRGRKLGGCDSRGTSRSKVQVHAGACACPMACVPRGRR